MQDYRSIAAKNGIELVGVGGCQFCGATTTRGVHECVELFSLGFECLDYSKPAHHRYRFLSVDAHTLQHSEIHGRWNNHFHLLRLHLMLAHSVAWSYQQSPRLSDYLNAYKRQHPTAWLQAPMPLQRGSVTTTDVAAQSINEERCKQHIELWAAAVHSAWEAHHAIIDVLALEFLKQHPALPRI